MRPLVLFLALLTAAPAAAQWTQIDTNYGVADAYATNLVAADATHLYATVLAGQPNPNRFLVLRSPDDGDGWTEVFSGFNGGVRGVFLGSIEGQWAALIRGNGETALLRSDDGAAWTETTARIPSSQTTSIARMGSTYVVVGSNPSYRSTDGGASWTTFGQDQPMGSVLAFGGSFYALSGIGQLHTLDGDAWTLVNFGSGFATNLWVDGAELWVKASASSLYASADGVAWSAQSTDDPTAWSTALPTPDDGTPWFLYASVFGQTHFLSDDDGANTTDITGDYPRNSNNTLCTSNFAVTPTSVIGNAWACASPDQNGVYRYSLGPGPIASTDGPDAQSLTIELAQNPTHGGTGITLRQFEAGPLTVTLSDALGRTIAQLVHSPHQVGETRVVLPQDLSPGVYIVRAVAGDRVASRTLTVMR